MKQILTVFLLLSSSVLFGQKTIEITIDSNCQCNNTKLKKLKGRFELRASITERLNSRVYQDTLIQALSFESTQNITLQFNKRIHSYSLVYTSHDSLDLTNRYPFYFNQVQGDKINLNCFFFNASYPSILDELEKKDTAYFYSQYSGNTHEMMSIPYQKLRIIRDGNQYCASYISSAIKPYDNFMRPLEEVYSETILLTEAQAQIIRNFENNLWKEAIYNDDGMGERSSLIHNNRYIVFYSKQKIPTVLWEQLTVPK